MRRPGEVYCYARDWLCWTITGYIRAWMKKNAERPDGP